MDHLRKAGLRPEDDLVLDEERPVDGNPDQGCGVEVAPARAVDDDGEVLEPRKAGDRPGHRTGPEGVLTRRMLVFWHRSTRSWECGDIKDRF